jgi:hypothetical protein
MPNNPPPSVPRITTYHFQVFFQGERVPPRLLEAIHQVRATVTELVATGAIATESEVVRCTSQGLNFAVTEEFVPFLTLRPHWNGLWPKWKVLRKLHETRLQEVRRWGQGRRLWVHSGDFVAWWDRQRQQEEKMLHRAAKVVRQLQDDPTGLRKTKRAR